MQLSLILTSLYDNNHISTLLGFSDSADHVTSSQPCDGSVDLMLAEILMKTILRNLANETVSKVNNHLCKLSIDFFTGCIGNLEGWGLPSPPTPQRKDGAVALPSAPGAGTVGQPIQGKGRYCQNIG